MFREFNHLFYSYSICSCFILFLLKYFDIFPLDIAIEYGNINIVKLFRDFIQNLFTENDSVKHFHCNAEAKNLSPASFHGNDTKRHIQNHDVFDEENDS